MSLRYKMFGIPANVEELVDKAIRKNLAVTVSVESFRYNHFSNPYTYHKVILQAGRCMIEYFKDIEVNLPSNMLALKLRQRYRNKILKKSEEAITFLRNKGIAIELKK